MNWQLVKDNIAADVNRLRLSHHGDKEWEEAILQIDCQQRVANKLTSTLNRFPEFEFPSTISAAQSTDDRIAAYHAKLIAPTDRVLDMTCGLGIDAYHIALAGAEVVACEMDRRIAECAERNYKGVSNLNIKCCDSTEMLSSLSDDSFDCIFIDPARRGEHGQRLFALADCKPDAVSLMPEMLRVAQRVIIKASPMLDVTQTLRELPMVKSVFAVGTKTECKELLIECRRNNGAEEMRVYGAVTVDDDEHVIETDSLSNEDVIYQNPIVGSYLYEPYPSIIKMSLWGELCRKFNIGKIAPSTHLFISSEYMPEFPGRCLQIEHIATMNKQQVKTLVGLYPAMDVTTRNFPLSSSQLAKRLKIKSGNQYKLIACGDNAGNNLLIVGRHSSM